ncbi:MAG TPA: hypothetical protein PKW28_14470, partial [Turneriella sp.]|nr:hypothetical protein [Turneriella sp.]
MPAGAGVAGAGSAFAAMHALRASPNAALADFMHSAFSLPFFALHSLVAAFFEATAFFTHAFCSADGRFAESAVTANTAAT